MTETHDDWYDSFLAGIGIKSQRQVERGQVECVIEKSGNQAISTAMNEWRQKKKQEKASRALNIPNWPQLRSIIIERDNYVCRICGSDPCEKPLNVHHVDWNRTNNKLRNLVTLCSDCHRAIHTHGYRPDGTDNEPWGSRD